MILGPLLLASLTQVSIPSPDPTPRPDPAALGPQIGALLPPLEVVDSTGRPRTFESLRGPKGLVLVIFRSADW